MRKMIYSILVIVIAILLGAPFISGYIFKQKYYQIVDKFNAQSPYQQLVIEHYNLGWLHSTVKLTYKITMEGKSQAIFELPGNITHGPFLKDNKGLTFGYGKIQYALFFIQPFQDMLKAQFGNLFDQGIVKINSLYDFNKVWHSTYKIDPIVLEQMISPRENFTLNWQGLEGTDSYQLNNNGGFDNLSFNITSKDFDLKHTIRNVPFKEIIISPINISLISKNGKFHYLFERSDFKLLLPKLTVSMINNQNFVIENYQLMSNAAVVNDKLSGVTQLSIARLQFPMAEMPLVTDFNLTTTVNNLNAVQLENLLQKFDTYELSKEKALRAMNEWGDKLMSVFSNNSDINVNVSGKTQFGNFSMDAKSVLAPNIPANVTLLTFSQYVVITLNARVSVNLVDHLVQLFGPTKPVIQPTSIPASVPPPAVPGTASVVDAAVTSGSVNTNPQASTMTNPSNMTASTPTAVAPPNVATVNNNTSVKSDNPEDFIHSLEAQGIIHKENNDYVVHLEFKNKKLYSNGKEVTLGE